MEDVFKMKIIRYIRLRYWEWNLNLHLKVSPFHEEKQPSETTKFHVDFNITIPINKNQKKTKKLPSL